MVPEVVGPRLLAAGRPGQPGLVPDPGEHRSDRCRGDLVAGGGDEERRPRGELCARDARSQAARTPTTWAVTGSLRLRFPLDQTMSMCPASQVDLPGLQGAGLTGPQPARVHQREERDRLPSPRGLGLQCRGRGEERLDLLLLSR